MNVSTEKLWYLLQCKPKQELRAFENLQRQGYECVLPMHKFERLQKGQWRIQEQPLFPGYLFIELDIRLDNWMPIRSTRGVSHIVRFGAEPLPVPGKVIEQIQQKENSPEQALKPGDKVLIDWAGASVLEAIFVSKDGTERVLLLLKILQREVQVSTPIQGLVKAS